MKKIVIIGPESTGKSSLCEGLANHFHTIWCREYAREYLLKNGTDYSFDNLLEVAKGQIALEDKAMEEVTKLENSTPELLFIDTDMYVMKVWCEYVFNNCHPFILEQIIE
ncbi:MAG TPA: AAA family ATPase, partial [Arachidicoccus sp.]